MTNYYQVQFLLFGEMILYVSINPLTTNVPHHIETSQVTYIAQSLMS